MTPTLSAPLYYVRSESNPTIFYTVAQVDDRCACGQRIPGLVHCSCLDHRHRARDCKHIRRVAVGAVRPARPKVAPVPLSAADAIYGTDAERDPLPRRLAALRKAS